MKITENQSPTAPTAREGAHTLTLCKKAGDFYAFSANGLSASTPDAFERWRSVLKDGCMPVLLGPIATTLL